jgi:hypothetical protein
MTPETLRATAEKVAQSLGISLYINAARRDSRGISNRGSRPFGERINEGRIHQIGPGERIDPPKTAPSSESHGRFHHRRDVKAIISREGEVCELHAPTLRISSAVTSNGPLPQSRPR